MVAGAVLCFIATSGPTYVPVLIQQVAAVPSATAPPCPGQVPRSGGDTLAIPDGMTT
jgi:hypothetical protein